MWKVAATRPRYSSSKITPGRRPAPVASTCHGEGHEQAHFSESAHSSSNVGCLDCHSPHHAKEKPYLLVQSTPQLCYGCHTSAKADFAKPYHHRVNEGLLQCNDCHNPHGTAIADQLRTMPNGDAICYKCHVDKQGPFVYEHVPVKTEGCVSCHTPHGSTNPRFLRVSLVNMLCLQCHSFPTSGAGRTGSQSVREVSGLHDVPRGDSRLQLQRCLFQVRETHDLAPKTRPADPP